MKFQNVFRKIRDRYSPFWHILQMKKKKFNIGAGVTKLSQDWYSTDIDTLNITKESDWKRLLFYLRLDKIMAEHVWEHLTEDQTKLANRNCYKFLKKDGVLRIAVPDGYHPDRKYIEYVMPGGSGAGADDHKILYNYKTLKEILEIVGFRVNLLEYWDELGQFHFTNWSNDGGKIERSRRYDPRNSDGKLNYTSLIVDAVK
jgi:predicted SAM-dependent methyltransferase